MEHQENHSSSPGTGQPPRGRGGCKPARSSWSLAVLGHPGGAEPPWPPQHRQHHCSTGSRANEKMWLPLPHFTQGFCSGFNALLTCPAPEMTSEKHPHSEKKGLGRETNISDSFPWRLETDTSCGPNQSIPEPCLVPWSSFPCPAAHGENHHHRERTARAQH